MGYDAECRKVHLFVIVRSASVINICGSLKQLYQR
jgi:hypothetical protein